jgi:hypothetical protein
MADTERLHLVKDLPDGSAIATVKCVGSVAVDATQGTTGQAHESSGPARRAGFTLDGVENLGNAERTQVEYSAKRTGVPTG